MSARPLGSDTFCGFGVCLFLPCRHRGKDSLPPRLRSGKGCGTGNVGISSAHGRDNTLDQLALQRNANLPDGSRLWQRQGARPGCQRLSSVAARLCVVSLCLSLGLLHSVARLRFPPDACRLRVNSVGFQHLFPHHNCRRSLLEGDGACLSAANDSRYSACLPREIPLGLCRNGNFRRP